MKSIKSKVLQDLLDQMEKDNWWIKLKREIRLKVWLIRCYFRKINLKSVIL